MSDLTPPHNLDAEKAVLGAVLVNDGALNKAIPILAGEDFYRAAHATIWEAMVALAMRNEAIDLLTLKNELARTGMLDECGGPAYISAMTEGVPKSANIAHYARIVRDLSRAREIMAVAKWLGQEASKAEAAPSQLLGEASARLSKVDTGERGGAVNVAESVLEYVGALAEGTAPVPVPTGYVDLDTQVHGIRPKSLVIVAARPSVGKTAFALGLAEKLASSGRPCALFTLEVSLERLSAQLLSWKSGVATEDLERGDMGYEAYERVGRAASSLSSGGLPLFVIESAATLLDVRGWCRRLKSEHGLQFALVDYLQLLSTGQRAENRQVEIETISRGLMLLAKELGISVVALSQLGRASEARKDKRPHVSDLRESGALEQDADMVLLLFRPEMYSSDPEDEGVAEVIIGKNRDGPTGVVRMAFVKRLAKFEDLVTGG